MPKAEVLFAVAYFSVKYVLGVIWRAVNAAAVEVTELFVAISLVVLEAHREQSDEERPSTATEKVLTALFILAMLIIAGMLENPADY
jgi:hypothetical protein